MTGPASPPLLAPASESLAGRLGLLELAPFLPSVLIRRLPPNFANVQKRLTRSPKLYLRDAVRSDA